VITVPQFKTKYRNNNSALLVGGPEIGNFATKMKVGAGIKQKSCQLLNGATSLLFYSSSLGVLKFDGFSSTCSIHIQ